MSRAQLSRLLPLPDSELQQILDYASTLSKDGAAEHLSNLLGDSPEAVSFIASFNGKREGQATDSGPVQPSSSSAMTEPVPKSSRAPKKKKAPLHMPQPRKVGDFGPAPGAAYHKKNQDLDYMPTSKRSSPGPTSSAEPSKVNMTSPPLAGKGQTQTQKQNQLPGFLISDIPSKTKSKSNTSSRSSTPKPNNATTKISITGGTPMTGASGAIADLDAAIRTLEVTTNWTLDADASARRCNCVATRHPLQTAAPNCLSCGKVICMKEGLGPCTSCGTPLLSSDETQAIIRELKAERGRERRAADREVNRRPDVGKTPAPFTQPRDGFGAAGASLSEAEVKAREHRDRLLGFQAQNARRTTVRDEAADFDFTAAMSGSGSSVWSSPEERALELKRQQKLLREMEWDARPEYEKRRQVVSIDLVGGKVVKKMAAVERPRTPDEDIQKTDYGALSESSGNRGSPSHAQGGAFSKNPLLGPMIKPVYGSKGKGREAAKDDAPRTKWRRVQDDLDDNEAVILDGGVYGYSGATEDGKAGDEPACG